MFLGIHGRKRVGKDTLSRLLVLQHGFAQVAFADPIREMLNSLGVPRYYTEEKNVAIPGLGKTYTELCQTLGTDWGRLMVSDTIWIDIAKARAREAFVGSCCGVVFSDVRYANEAEAVRSLGGKIIFLEGSRGISVNDHTSESSLDEQYRDFTLRNDGSIADLDASLSEFMQKLYCTN